MARLLIIDSEKACCQAIETPFRKNGHMVETASSGLAGKEKIDTVNYHVIISEIRMPGITGIELLEHARATKTEAAFILMTAVPTMATAIQGLNLGASRYVIKTDRLVEELTLSVEHALKELPPREEDPLPHHGDKAIQIPDEGINFKEKIAGVEKQYLQAALDAAGGDRRRAADLLKMADSTFRRYAKKHAI
jgi:DNA-binding NtrC family response regulator